MPRLPKLPPTPPRRPAPNVERSPVIEVLAWEDEESTGKVNQSLATYQSLLSVFDGLTQPERLEFVELAARWAELPREERAVLLGLISRR